MGALSVSEFLAGEEGLRALFCCGKATTPDCKSKWISHSLGTSCLPNPASQKTHLPRRFQCQIAKYRLDGRLELSLRNIPAASHARGH